MILASCARRSLPTSAACLVDRDCSVAALVRVDPENHHGPVSFTMGRLGPAGGNTSVGAMPRSYQAMPVAPMTSLAAQGDQAISGRAWWREPAKPTQMLTLTDVVYGSVLSVAS